MEVASSQIKSKDPTFENNNFSSTNETNGDKAYNNKAHNIKYKQEAQDSYSTYILSGVRCIFYVFLLVCAIRFIFLVEEEKQLKLHCNSNKLEIEGQRQAIAHLLSAVDALSNRLASIESRKVSVHF